jgi:hypothetical protein
MLLAAKYCEIYAPEVRDFVFISDKAYTGEQILKMESTMLNALEFRLSAPTVLSFLPRFLKAAASDMKTRQVASYYAERTLQEMHMLKYLPSTIAAAAVSLANSAMGMPAWTPALAHHSRYSAEAIAPCVRDMHAIMKTCDKRSLQVRSGQGLLCVLACLTGLITDSFLCNHPLPFFAQAVRKKYTSSKFLEVAAVPVPAFDGAR